MDIFLKMLKKNLIRFSLFVLCLCTFIFVFSFVNVYGWFAYLLMVLYWVLMIPVGAIELLCEVFSLDLGVVKLFFNNHEWLGIYTAGLLFFGVLAFGYTYVSYLVMKIKRKL